MCVKNCWISCGIYLGETSAWFGINYLIKSSSKLRKVGTIILFADRETEVLINWLICWSSHRWIRALNPHGQTHDLFITKEFLSWKLEWCPGWLHQSLLSWDLLYRWKLGSSQQNKRFHLDRLLPCLPASLPLLTSPPILELPLLSSYSHLGHTRVRLSSGDFLESPRPAPSLFSSVSLTIRFSTHSSATWT